MKTVLGLLALAGLAVLVYSVLTEREQVAPEANNDELDEKQKPEINSVKENKYDSFLEEKRQRFKNSLEYTPYKEIEIQEEGKQVIEESNEEKIEAQIQEHGNCDVLDKISKNEIGIAQITIVNSSNDYREVNLWGTGETSVSTPLLTDVEDQQLIGSGPATTGIYPQNIAISPLTGLVYVVNQLSDSVSVYDGDGIPITTVLLGASISGGISPVALDFNPLNGEAWIVGSVSNNIYVIDRFFNISQIISSGGRRPLAIKYHILNNSFYVANMVDGVMSAINAATYIQTISVNPGAGRPSLEVEQESGRICVLNAASSVLLVYNLYNAFLGVVAGLSANSTLVVKGNEQGKFFVLSSTDVKKIDIDLFSIVTSSLLPSIGSGITYNAFNDYLYVLSNVSGQMHYYDQNLVFHCSLSSIKPNIGVAINSENGRFYFTDTSESLLYNGGYLQQSSYITISDDYAELKNALSQVSGLILDLKISFSTGDKFSNLFIKKRSITGLSKGEALSMNAYYAPQAYSNVAIVYGMRGEILNPKVEWRFAIAPFQSITFLIKILQQTISPDRQLGYAEKIIHQSRAA